MKKILFLTAISVFLTACGGAATNVANNSNSKPNEAAPAVSKATPVTPASAATPKPDTGPKRIAFKKGEFSGGENVTLAAGASATFVVGAGSDQKVYIESSEKSGKIKITSGKVNEISNSEGYYEGLTTSKGDLVFTITNPGKAPMKSKLSITLVPNGD